MSDCTHGMLNAPWRLVEDAEGERWYLVPEDKLKDFETWLWDVNDDDEPYYDVEPIPSYAEPVFTTRLRIHSWTTL
jgi:hypothetical protein